MKTSDDLDSRIRKSISRNGIEEPIARQTLDFTLDLFYSIPDHVDHEDNYLRIIKGSLDSPFSGTEEFNRFYDNIFNFTLRSSASTDMTRYVFPHMDSYISLQRRIHIVNRMNLHADLAKIFKEDSLVADIDKLGNRLFDYGCVEDARRY